MISDGGVNSVKLTWSASSVIGVLRFIITATNLNVSSIPLTISDIRHPQYTFTVLSRTACDTYGFQVTAVNRGKEATASDIVTAVMPTLPDISLVELSNEYFLLITEMGATITVTFNV